MQSRNGIQLATVRDKKGGPLTRAIVWFFQIIELIHTRLVQIFGKLTILLVQLVLVAFFAHVLGVQLHVSSSSGFGISS